MPPFSAEGSSLIFRIGEFATQNFESIVTRMGVVKSRRTLYYFRGPVSAGHEYLKK